VRTANIQALLFHQRQKWLCPSLCRLSRTWHPQIRERRWQRLKVFSGMYPCLDGDALKWWKVCTLSVTTLTMGIECKPMAYDALRSRVFVPICTPSSQFKTSFLTATLIPPFFPLLLSNICSSYFCSCDCKSLIETSTSVSCPEYWTGFHFFWNIRELSCIYPVSTVSLWLL